MDHEAALKKMLARSRRLSGGEELPHREAFFDAEQYRQAWFRHWLKSNGVSISGFAAVSGMGRTSISSLAGSGKGLLWPRLDRRSVEAIVRTMNLIAPMDVEILRLALQVSGELESWTQMPEVDLAPGPTPLEVNQAREEVAQAYSRQFSGAGIAQRRLLMGRDLDDEIVPSQTYRVLAELTPVRSRTDTNTRSQALRQVLRRYLEDGTLPIDPVRIPPKPRQALTWVLRPDEAATWRALDPDTRTGIVNSALRRVNQALSAGRYERVLLGREDGIRVQAMTAGPGRAVTRAYLRQPGGSADLLTQPLYRLAGQPVLATSEQLVGHTLLWELLSTAERPARVLAVFQAPSFYDAVVVSCSEALEEATVDPLILDAGHAHKWRRR